MKIIINEKEPIELYSYLEVGTKQSNSGTPIIVHKNLPIYFGEYEHENSEMDYLIICSDLQGVVEEEGEYILLGEVLPEFLKLLIDIERKEIGQPKIGVFLCGDMYTSMDKRGGSGDVRNVWFKFKEYFDWVVGVAGNHDKFGTKSEELEFKSTDNIFFLHKEIITIGNLNIGGIIGRNSKLFRVDEKEYLNSLDKLLRKKLDFVLLHETPDFPEKKFIGNPKIREIIERHSGQKICCGHCYWSEVLVEFSNKNFVMNLDSKVVILRKR